MYATSKEFKLNKTSHVHNSTATSTTIVNMHGSYVSEDLAGAST